MGFDATAAARQAAGIGRYTRELLRALSTRDDDTNFRLYYCSGGRLEGHLPKLGSRFRTRSIPVSDRITNAIWHRGRVPLPVQTIIGSFDLFHAPDFTAPPTCGKPVVLTIHDLAFLTVPECAYPSLRDYLQEAVPRAARRATHIIAVSHNTRRDVIDLLRAPEERVTTVYEAVGQNFAPMEASQTTAAVRRLGIHEPYILSTGTLEPRKNYERLLEAFSLTRSRGLTESLVIAGGKGWLYEPIFEAIRHLHLEQHVHCVRPTDEELVALYSAAQCFVYPSLYEGFGIPPLEALACGAPVICSNRSSLPEVVGDAALLVDPTDIEELSAALERLLGDTALRAELRARGLRRAQSFSWDRAARETLEVYQQVTGHA